MSNHMTREFEALIQAAKDTSADVSEEVEMILREGVERPLTKTEARRLLQKIVTVVRGHARARGDDETDAAMADERFIEEVLAARERLSGRQNVNGRKLGKRISLEGHNSIPVSPVFPRPTFHGREVAMMGGFVKLNDIALWEENERLDVHVRQYEQEHGRLPTGEELLQIMLSEMPLKGLNETDQFRIVDLARSIANNGVRRPPIIDIDGTLLDGNRRVAASHFVLSSDEFTTEQKKRVERIYVWQLTEHALDEERDLVVVSLNFEPDYKQDWPTYVKARRIYEEWERVLSLEPRNPSAQRMSDLKRQISLAFTLGPKLDTVNRYIKMVEAAEEFESYLVDDQNVDEFEVKHSATKRFEYFDELQKGANPGGVAHTLGRDESLKHLVFDLLFQSKFKNFTQIRDLKHVPDNPDMRAHLEAARSEPSLEIAREKVQDALDVVRSRRAEKRRLGANARIASFVEWLEDVPLRTFRDDVSQENLEGLLGAFRLVRHQAIEILGEDRVQEILD